MTDNQLCGFRILLVEDNALLAMTTDEILRCAGAEIAGPVGTLREAEQLAACEALSAALLDIKLHADEVWSVARILAERGVPFVFCSGHFDRDSLPDEWADYPILTKPVRAHRIIDSLAGVINGPA
ncbi:MAG: response regulator [Xanthobacteraceae bacterium]